MNRWNQHEAGILVVDSEQIKKTGLQRASRYELLTYEEMLEVYKIEDLFKATSALEVLDKRKILDQKYVVPTIWTSTKERRLDVVGYDLKPLKREVKDKKTHEEIVVIAGELLPKFAQLTKDITLRKTVDENLAILKDTDTSEGTEEKIVKWVNEYGLPFAYPFFSSSRLSTLLEDELRRSDILYQLMRHNYDGYLPYFMSLDSIVQLSSYSAWLVYGSYLLKILKHHIRYDKEVPCEDEIITTEDFQKFFVEFAKYVDGTNIEIIENDIEKDGILIHGPGFSHQGNEEYFQYSLGNHLTQWISYIIPYGASKNHKHKVTFNDHFSCQSLMSLMALEQYSMVINENTAYKKCLYAVCKNTFNTKSRRSDAKYCSQECRIADFRKRKKLKINR